MKKWKDKKLICLVEKKNEKIKNVVVGMKGPEVYIGPSALSEDI